MPTGVSSDVARVKKRLHQFSGELVGQPAAARLKRVGKALAEDVEQEVRNTPSVNGSLADQSMSGWPRKNPMKIGARFTVHGARDVMITPGRGAGPLRVLEDGRQGHGVGEGLLRVRKTKSGALRTSHRIVGRKTGRAIGATKGKGTWSKATRVMARNGATRMRLEIGASFKKTFGG